MESRFQEHHSGLMTITVPDRLGVDRAKRMSEAFTSDPQIRYVGCDSTEILRLLEDEHYTYANTKFEILSYPTRAYHHQKISRIEEAFGALNFFAQVGAFIEWITEQKPCSGDFASLPVKYGNELRVIIFSYRPGSIVEEEKPVWHFHTESIESMNMLLMRQNFTILGFRPAG